MESNLDWALRYAALGLTPGVDLYTIQKAGGWKTRSWSSDTPT
jgi:hypothetical protein